MRFKSIKLLSIFASALFMNVNTAQASACLDACTAAEAAAQVLCVVEIFGEPECSIAAAAGYAACTAACVATSNKAALVATPEVDPAVAKILRNSDFCNGKLKAKNIEMAKKFCDTYK